MKILWESSDWPGGRIEPAITHLAWIPQQDRPTHGLLGVGCDSGSVGVTYTNFHPAEDDCSRYNFNLRGHHSAIFMVAWNRTHCKLASCDGSGVIYVWIRNEDRWSVELVNDRGVKVRDLCWSPCGTAALICYEDNFVLIGSASGQRIWSNSFPVATVVTCGVWAFDSSHIVLGYSSGRIQVLSDQGASITERTFIHETIFKLAYSAEKDGVWTLAILTARNKILMVHAYDEIDPVMYESSSPIVQIQWNPEGTLLALINGRRELIFLDNKARCVHRESMFTEDVSLTAMTWAHEGKSIIVAGGGHLATGKLHIGVPSLFNLVTYDLWRFMGSTAKKADRLPLPLKERNALRSLDHHIIKCRIPRNEDLRTFVCSVTDARCYCTIRPLTRGSHSYVLCMEHLGGLVPLLIGRQVNRFLPQFHVSLHPSNIAANPPPVGSSAQVEDVSIIPRASTGRNSLWRRSKRHLRALMSRHVRPSRPDMRLVQVSSNVWCTRFNITSMSKFLPDFLGQVVYKTSVLHLQPRQMTIDLALLSSIGKRDEQSLKPSLCPSPASSEQDLDDVSRLQANKLFEGDGLTKEERAFFDKVVSECTSLRAAMNGGSLEFSSLGHVTSQVAAFKDVPTRADSRQGESDLTLSTTSTWHDEIEALEFIDGAEDRVPLLPPSPSSVQQPTDVPSRAKKSVPGEKFRSEIQTDLDRLVRIAGQLSHRYDFNSKRDRASINKMRSQMKELLRKVNEIEKKVGSDDVRAEVRQLMRTLREIKTALGEGRPPAPQYNRVLTLHNKTPFWNEQNQVYQLDFGGRVTQESAKNFQVELDGRQVLQFGRIDGGAYTLDFCRPLSASQAFAVALASITQRLK